MADIRGRDAKFAVSTDGVTYQDLGGCKDASWSIDQSTVDVTDFASGAWTEHLVGRKTVTASVTVNYDEADAGLDIVLASWQAATQIYIRYRPRGDTTGADQYVALATITSCEDSSPNDDAAEASISFQVTSSVTVSAIPA